MKCSACEAKLLPNSIFCNSCGTKVSLDPASTSGARKRIVFKPYIAVGTLLLFLVIGAVIVIVANSSSSSVSTTQLLNAFASSKELKLSSDKLDGQLVYGKLGKEVNFYNALPLGILQFASTGKRADSEALTVSLIKHYAPGEQIFSCKNIIGMYDLKFQSEILARARELCFGKNSNSAIKQYSVTPFLGELYNYTEQQTHAGLKVIISKTSANSYSADFLQDSQAKGGTRSLNLGIATFIDQGNGLLKVTWPNGDVNTASQNGGDINFECAGEFSGIFLSRADCWVSQSDNFNYDLSLLDNVASQRWLNLDTASSDPVGYFANVKSLKVQSGNGLQINLYAEGQDGSVGQVASAVGTDMGFGYFHGKWADGNEAYGAYTTYQVPVNILKGVTASAYLQIDCSQEPSITNDSFYQNEKSCQFYKANSASANS